MTFDIILHTIKAPLRIYAPFRNINFLAPGNVNVFPTNHSLKTLSIKGREKVAIWNLKLYLKAFLEKLFDSTKYEVMSWSIATDICEHEQENVGALVRKIANKANLEQIWTKREYHLVENWLCPSSGTLGMKNQL